MISYSEFVTKLRREIWPFPGEPKSQVAAHSKFFLEAFIDLQKVVKCLQANHTDVHPACSTFVDCGKTVFDAPRQGIIKRVYTIANGDWCSRVFYDPSNFNKVDCWSRNLLSTFTPSTRAGLPALQQGIKYADASTDSKWGRSRVGLWCQHRGRLYVTPWVQSNESVIVEWDGVKVDWQDGDQLADGQEGVWTPDVAGALKLYVQWCHQRDFGMFDTASGEERQSKQDYLDARADLIWWCEQRTREREAEECVDNLPSAAQVKAEAVPSTGPQVFAIVGDFGSNNQTELDVANLIKGWDPAYIVTTGDNWYGPGNTGLLLSDLDAAVGKYYQQFIAPYSGAYGSGDDEQSFFPTWGNHDIDPVGRLALEKQYFNQSGDYYDFVVGPVHCFIYASGYNNAQVLVEPDGNDVNSKQGAWLQAKLALSTAPFKLVFVHHPPYSSTVSAINVAPLAGDGTISFPALRLPFKAWGADAVLSGHVHNYERLLDGSGMTYICNGAGGKDGQVAGEPAIYHDPPLAISQVRYNADFGAIKASVSCGSLTLEFWSRGGVLVDSFVINK